MEHVFVWVHVRYMLHCLMLVHVQVGQSVLGAVSAANLLGRGAGAPGAPGAGQTTQGGHACALV